MTSSELGNLREKYSSTLVKADAYFVHHTGMIPNQTLLKMGDYNLNGTPATMGFHSLTCLFVLTQEEVAFFSRFTKSLHLLTLVFQSLNRKDPIRIPLRVTLDRIDIVGTRKNLSMMVFTIKNESTDLIDILGNYMALLDYKRESCEKLADTVVPLDSETAAAIGFNDYLEIVGGEKPRRVRASGFTTQKVFLKSAPAGEPGSYTQLKWYFRDGLVINDGKLDLSDPAHPVFLMEFHPRIVDAVEDHLFKSSLVARNKA